MFVLDEDQELHGRRHDDSADKGKTKKKARETDDETEERTTSRPTLVNPGGIGLPTPAKTPSRKRKLGPQALAKSAQALFPPTETSSSRSASKGGGLFGVRRSHDTSSALSTPRRRKSKFAGTLEVEHEEETSIAIFTDSDARRPTVDADPDNPFLSRPSDETRSSKKKRQQMADKLKNRLGSETGRLDGMYYMFRGKKVFKKFDNLPDWEDRAAAEDEDDVQNGLNPLEVKPRILFPSSAKKTNSENIPARGDQDDEAEVDEEAETEVDEPQLLKSLHRQSPSIKAKRVMPKGPPSVASRMTPESDDDEILFEKVLNSKKKLSRSRALFDDGEDDDPFAIVAKSSIFTTTTTQEEENVLTRTKSTKRPRALDPLPSSGLATPQTAERKRARRFSPI